ncbi:lipoprotein [Bilophila wadsworthia]|uniref:lipoprotein n=1 Tax=Bilophila wadsworthia TaxID=35833 RepID=UPI0034CE0AD3
MKRLFILLGLTAALAGCGESPEFVVAGVRKSTHCIGGYEFAAVRGSSRSIALAQIMPPRECRE